MSESLLGPIISLTALGLSLAWAVFLRAGVRPSDWVSAVFFIGCSSSVYWMFARRRMLAPPAAAWFRWAVFALACYCVFQCVPLPLGLLKMFSPAKAQLVANLAPVMPGVRWAPLSVNPPMAVFWTFSLFCYIATFFLVRQLGWRFFDRPWIVVLPLILIAGLEALIGAIEISFGGPNTERIGTYTNRDHFSGMLELILPFALTSGWSILREGREDRGSSGGRVIQAGLLWAIAALVLVIIVYSVSRMEPFVVLCSLVVVAALSFAPHLPSENFRMGSLTALAVGSLALFVFLPPDQLMVRFADMSASSKLSADMRLSFWKDALSLIYEFRWFGCGLGGFGSAFLKHQSTAAAFQVMTAYNDYLQYLAELGLVGFAILTAAIAGVITPMVRGIMRVGEESRRLILIACAGSFTAIALHSLVDFSLYIPANAMVLAWVSGVASINGLD